MKKLLIILLTINVLFSCKNKPANTNEAGLNEKPTSSPVAIVIHGGAGTILKENMDPEIEMAIRAKLKEALSTGYEILEKGGSSLDAVVATIQVMEESYFFNAGKGAVFTNQGKNELDASIMDGHTGGAGAVAGVTTIKSPIAAARAVMERSPHVMMAGEGAALFAAQEGLEIVDPEYFRDEARYQQWLKIKEREKDNRQGYYGALNNDEKFGTVGCVALDKNGNLAAGTSTGGMTNKKYGRIGDSPIIGAGTYADNSTCGVSSTGHGEFFIRNVVAYDIAALMKYKNMTLEDAAHEVVMNKLVKKGGTGGVIAMDAEGNIAMPFNTSGMYRGYMREKNNPLVFIYKNE